MKKDGLADMPAFLVIPVIMGIMIMVVNK